MENPAIEAGIVSQTELQNTYSNKSIYSLNPTDSNIVSLQVVSVVSLVAVCLLSTIFGAMGVCTNSIHLAVYIKQGNTDGASVSLTALAFSDLWISLMHVFMGLCFTLDLLKIRADRVDWIHVMEIVFAWPRSMMAAISASITVFISAERALCVVWPLKVGTIVTRKRSIVVVTFIYVAMVTMFAPAFFTAGISWQTVQVADSSNTTRSITKLHMWRGPQRDAVEIGVNIADAICHFFCYGLTISFSIIMARGLYKASRFREKSVNVTESTDEISTTRGDNDNKKGVGLSTRDRRAITMVSAVTIMYIVCTSPIMLAFMWRFANPNIITGGSQENLLAVLFSFVYLAESVCASCNIFIYLSISTRYRRTFYSLFTCSKDDK